MGPGTFRDFSEPKPETGGKIQHIQYHFKSPFLPSALCQQNIFCQSLLLLLKGKSVKKVMDPQYNHFKSIFLTFFQIFSNQLTKTNKSKLLVKVYQCRNGLFMVHLFSKILKFAPVSLFMILMWSLAKTTFFVEKIEQLCHQSTLEFLQFLPAC